MVTVERLEGSQISPHRLELREATSGKPLLIVRSSTGAIGISGSPSSARVGRRLPRTHPDAATTCSVFV
jgi:hypothetical protein